MLRKKFLFLLLSMVMVMAIPVPVRAVESPLVQVEVACEQDILDYLSSPEYRPNLKYEFIYSAPTLLSMRCPNCGYNAYSSKINERYNLNKPMSQGRQVTCPSYQPPGIDVVTEMLVYIWQECDVCGYKTKETYQETKWYVYCTQESFDELIYVATDYKTLNRIGVEHEWKDQLDAGWTLGCDGP